MLLAFDLDNTVVTRSHELPREIERAVWDARDAGHHVTVLTGRPLSSAHRFVQQLGVTPGPYSVNHGALVFGVQGEILRRKRMTVEHVRSVLAPAALPKGVPFACIIDDALFVNDPHDERWAWAHTANRRVERFDYERIGEVDKIVFGGNGESEAMEARILAEHTLTVYRWGDGFLEVTADEADKGSALALIAAQLGVAREDTVAFGDGTNDVSMLAWAGRGVSVGPYALEEVRALAQEHIDAPEELGVAHWLRRHALP